MTCEELSESYDLFALGMDGAESSEIRDHLRINCPNCVPGVQQGLALVTQLGGIVKIVEPPARLRTRILTLVNPPLASPAAEQKQRRGGFGWAIVFAGAAIVFLSVAVVLGLQTQRLTNVRRAEIVRLEEALAVMSAPDSREVSFGTSANLPPRGKVIVNRRRGVVLIAAHLPSLEDGKTFELWLIPNGAKPIASGTFQSQPDGTALALKSGAVPANLGIVAVTVENEGGVDAPTTTPIIAAETK